MSPKKRKLYLLMNDRTVKKTKKTLSFLKDHNRLQSAKWVLIPIQNTSCIYIAVDGHTISTICMDNAKIRYHMKLKRLERTGREIMDIEVQDYYTTTVYASTIEELYNALYNILFFRYMRNLYEVSNNDEFFWYIDVCDIEITLFHGTKVTDRFYVEGAEKAAEIPFDYDNVISDEIISHYGLAFPNDSITIPNICMMEDPKKGLCWFATKSPIELTSNVRYVLSPNTETRSYTFQRADEYDCTLRITDAALYISPIDLSCSRLDYEELPIAAFYKIAKYEFSGWYDNDITWGSTRIFHDYGSYVLATIDIEALEESDIFFMIENLYYIMRVYHEGMSVYMMQNHTDLKEDPHIRCTVLTVMCCHLSARINAPDDGTMLVIATDCFEDDPPNLKEVAYLLKLDEQAK